MPDPRSRAAAGRRMAGPPLLGTPGEVVPAIELAAPLIMLLSCATAIGIKTSMARRAAVARNIVLFIQSSFVFSVSKRPALASSYREVPTVYRTETQKSPLS
jgi:hypothetical protein